MKYRHLRVLVDLSARRQEEIGQYQGFREIADRERWRVLAVSDGFESRVRHLSARGLIDAVAGDFISGAWLDGLPSEVLRVHLGADPLGEAIPSVCWDLEAAGGRLAEHFREAGYDEVVLYSSLEAPRLRRGLEDVCGDVAWVRTLEALRERLGKAEGVGVACPGDYSARTVLRMLRRSGRRVPEDFGVAGMGNRSLDGVLADLPLTSLELPFRERGRRAGTLLRDLASGAPPRREFLAPGRLVPRESTRRHPDRDRLRSRVEGWVLPNLQDPPPVAEWARRAGMSRRSFERAFAAETGVPPYEYLLQLREREAKRLLRDTDASLNRIGAEIGFPDPPRFSAFFKKRTGIPAGEWRKRSG